MRRRSRSAICRPDLGIGSGELVKLCKKELNWKKPTTYTVLRKLCERGIFQNKDSVVTSLISAENFSQESVEEAAEKVHICGTLIVWYDWNQGKDCIYREKRKLPKEKNDL